MSSADISFYKADVNTYYRNIMDIFETTGSHVHCLKHTRIPDDHLTAITDRNISFEPVRIGNPVSVSVLPD